MKLSTLTLGALLAGTLNGEAQTAAKDTVYRKPVKINKSGKALTPGESVTLKDSLKPAHTEKKRHFCMACGRG